MFMNQIRFCRSPIGPEHLNDDERRVYEEHAFVCAAMGDLAWSVDELLNQCAYHPTYSSLPHLSTALLQLMAIGMVRTEEAVFLEAGLERMERILDERFTWEDIKQRSGEMAVRFGGPGYAWFLDFIAHNARQLLQGVANLVESTATYQKTGERFVVSVRRIEGKGAMDLRRELLADVRKLAENGGATAEQLRALLDVHEPQNETPGIAPPIHDDAHPWLVLVDKNFRCNRCGVEKPVPLSDIKPVFQAFVEQHGRCLPRNATAGEILKALREERAAQAQEKGEGKGG